MVWLLAIALAAGGFVGWLAAGRRLPRAIDVRGFWLIGAALLLQIAAVRGRSVAGVELSAAAILLANAVLLYVLWLNRKRFGSLIAAIGIVLNLVVIVANGGFMPLDVTVLERSGHRPDVVVGEVPERSKGRVMPTEEIRLAPLADWIAKPGGGVMSLGDIVLALGIGIFVWELMADRPLWNFRRRLPERTSQEGFWE